MLETSNLAVIDLLLPYLSHRKGWRSAADAEQHLGKCMRRIPMTASYLCSPFTVVNLDTDHSAFDVARWLDWLCDPIQYPRDK